VVRPKTTGKEKIAPSNFVWTNWFEVAIISYSAEGHCMGEVKVREVSIEFIWYLFGS